MNKKQYYFSGLLGLLFTFNSMAETVYINDQIKVWSRTGPSNAYKVNFKLAPGDQLESLQTDSETGFIEVKDSRGRTGWIDGQLLSNKPTAHQKLAQAEKKIKSLTANHKQTVSELQKKITQMEPLEKVNSELQSELVETRLKLEQSNQKAQLYESGFKRDEFFGGATVLLGGMFFGWLFSRLGGKKRGSGWS